MEASKSNSAPIKPTNPPNENMANVSKRLSRNSTEPDTHGEGGRSRSKMAEGLKDFGRGAKEFLHLSDAAPLLTAGKQVGQEIKGFMKDVADVATPRRETHADTSETKSGPVTTESEASMRARFLNRRPTPVTLSQEEINSHMANRKQLVADMTDSRLRNQFEHFLSGEYMEENLYAWEAMRDYLQLQAPEPGHSSELYEAYFGSSAQWEVAIPLPVATMLDEAFQRVEYSEAMAREALQEAYNHLTPCLAEAYLHYRDQDQ